MAWHRSAHEERIYDGLHYPGPAPRVPVNKLDIRDWTALEKAESELVRNRIEEGLPADATQWSYAGLKALHGHLFQDVYDWAGMQRTYTAGRTHSFGPPEFIEAEMNKLFASLAGEGHLQGLEPEVFVERTAKYINDLNAIHPFIEGNGRVQRLWLQNLVGQAGHALDLSRIDKGQWYHASAIGFTSSDRPMILLLKANFANGDDDHVRALAFGRLDETPTHPDGAVLVPARELPDLTESEIGAHLAASSRLADKRSEIERLSMLVYGEQLAVSGWVEKIDGTAAGQAAGGDIEAGRPGVLAGEGAGWFRGEDAARQTAQAHVPQLARALEDYGRTIDFERHQAVRAHADEQDRHRQEISAPSPALAAVLQQTSPQEQVSRLRVAPALRDEMDKISLSLERRLSPSDKAALYRGDQARLAQSLSISRDRAASVARLAVQAGLVEQQARRQTRDLDRGGPVLSR